MVVGSKITKARQIVPVLDIVKQTGRPLLIFSTDMQIEPLSNIVYNNRKGLVTSCAVNIPWQAGEEIEVLKDIAILTGATFIDNSMMKSVLNVDLNSLGSCNRAHITAEQTQLSGAHGSNEKIEERILQLKTFLKTNKDVSVTKKKIILNRISRLNGLMGTLYIGGQTETIRNETRDKLIDALNACKSAIEKGILPGGGAALVHAAKLVENNLVLKNTDQRQGARIVLNAVSMPMRMILRNAGLNESIILNDVQEAEDPWIGYDVRKGILLSEIRKVARHV